MGLAEAQASGDLIADGETGMRFKDLYPWQASVQAKSRDDVRAELENASKVKANGSSSDQHVASP
ncbi:hypothetical protein [Hydrogenophaga sp.]|uniref:hypothetical protein n=1 Tax=Hydrogenophaga sp. TaxID=1904254 RepID=UPI00272FFADE|nr:hypothetical protein [Hydrogenophaga sp.]MDP2015712.1 hypothetical protein [Hydrogenophaga sp.]MDP3164788.1 hypothetical protein [Hydrogenophaga sp.]